MRTNLVLAVFVVAGMLVGCGQGQDVEVEVDPRVREQQQLPPEAEQMWREQQEEMMQ